MTAAGSDAQTIDGTSDILALPPALAGEHSKEILETLGLGQDEVNRLISSGSVA